MKRAFTIGIAVFVTLIVCGVSYATNKYTIYQLNNISDPGFSPQINASGQVVWQGYDGKIYLYNGTNVVNLSSNNSYSDFFPQINAGGQVVWMTWDDTDQEIFLYDGTKTVPLTDNSYDDFFPQINASGQVVWSGCDGTDCEIFLYNGTNVVNLSSNNSYDDFSPQINSSGQVVWVGSDKTSYDQVLFLYDPVKGIVQLANNSYGISYPKINVNGQVVWVERGDKIFLYDGTNVKYLALCSSGYCEHYNHHINDSGQVVWVANDSYNWWDLDKEIFLYDPVRGIVQLTNNSYDDGSPQINAGGQVVWVGYGYDGTDTEIFLYDPDTGIVQLTENSYWENLPQINDSGQVVWWASDGYPMSQIFLAVPDPDQQLRLIVPEDIMVQPTGQLTQVFYNVTAEDPVGNPVTAVCDHPSGSMFPFGLTTVTCRATVPGYLTVEAWFYIFVTSDNDRTAGSTIKPAGGSIVTPDGSVDIYIPPDALAVDTYIAITGTGNDYLLTSDQGAGTVISGILVQPDGTNFGVPITITLRWYDFDNNGIVDGTNIDERYLQVSKDGHVIAGPCMSEPSATGAECNMFSNYFSIQVSSLSEFALVFIDQQGPMTSNVMASPNPVELNTPVLLRARVDDSLTGGTIIGSAEYRVNEGGYVAMGAVDTAFDSTAENVESYLPGFAETGVNEICVRGWDIHGNVPGADECIFLPVYDPLGGFVTGGGWIMSPAGAYTADPTLTGKATFGFVSKYKKGMNVPTGNTEFQFRAGNLNFHSDIYSWLVVAGAKATFKGVGTINGMGSYKFILSAIDAELNANDNFTIDRFRIRIWEEDAAGVETVVYDNGMGDDSDNAMTEIGGGSIVIHTK